MTILPAGRPTRRAASTSVDMPAYTREYVLGALVDPQSYPEEVRRAIASVTAASRRAAGSSTFIPPRSISSSVDPDFDRFLEMVDETLAGSDVTVTEQEPVDIPHYVPPDWASFLDHQVIEDPADMTYPWLDELGHSD